MYLSKFNSVKHTLICFIMHLANILVGLRNDCPKTITLPTFFSVVKVFLMNCFKLQLTLVREKFIYLTKTKNVTQREPYYCSTSSKIIFNLTSYPPFPYKQYDVPFDKAKLIFKMTAANDRYLDRCNSPFVP